jgi:hypothetical protein
VIIKHLLFIPILFWLSFVLIKYKVWYKLFFRSNHIPREIDQTILIWKINELERYFHLFLFWYKNIYIYSFRVFVDYRISFVNIIKFLSVYLFLFFFFSLTSSSLVCLSIYSPEYACIVSFSSSSNNIFYSILMAMVFSFNSTITALILWVACSTMVVVRRQAVAV